MTNNENITFGIEYQLCDNGVWTQYTEFCEGKEQLKTMLNALLPQVAELIAVITRIYVR